tara:strand:+ start:2138 stop:2359 length:222 start_codon:yes stop_codon:yes gene_type:complete
MQIKINDTIKVGPLEGTITSISIGVIQGDPAGELGPKAVEYDTELGYQGAVTYVTRGGDSKWAYFRQIDEVIE